MSDLATLAITAHGGLDRWRRLKTVSAHLVQGGALWKLKGQDGVLDDVHLTVDLRKEWASHRRRKRARSGPSNTASNPRCLTTIRTITHDTTAADRAVCDKRYGRIM